MAVASDLSSYSDAMVVLAVAGVVVPLIRRLGVNPILGFIGLGALLGPHALGGLIGEVPYVSWFVVVDVHRVEAIAELGIVFLLFLIGLELSFSRLMTMRRLVFGFGSLQILLSLALLAGLMWLGGIETPQAIILGACLALSSTAIVIELLSERNKMTTSTGRVSFSVLLAQDIAVIPILLLIGLMASGTGGGLSANIGKALAQAAGALALIVISGRFFVRPLFRVVAQLKSADVFLATVLFVVVGSGFVAALFGMSMALGAFVGGLLLSETEYRKAVEALIEPFKGLLLGMFFFTVGMSIDLSIILDAPVLLAVAVVAIIVAKTAVVVLLGRVFKISQGSSLEAALLLAPGGEFAFVGIGAAAAAGLIDGPLQRVALTSVALTMVALPILSALGDRISSRLNRKQGAAPVEPPPEMKGHAIVVGHGRVGKVVTGMLAKHGIPFLAVEGNANELARDRRAGHDVYFGDATNPVFLHACGVEEASAVIITTGTRGTVDRVIEIVRGMRPDVPVIARATDAGHARHLYKIGVTDAVPETIEASLHLSEASLVELGVPMGLVIASIHERRDEFRAELRESSGGRPMPGDRARAGRAAE